MPFLGEFLALLVALVWSYAVILFKRGGETVHPVALNGLKNVIAVVLFVPTIWLMGESVFYPAPMEDYLLMLGAGVVGIALSDSLFFKSLNILGASRMAIVDCLYSPIIIFLSVVFLGEELSWSQLLGVVAILGAVVTPVFEADGDSRLPRKQILYGTGLGALALATMGVSLVAIKPILNVSPVVWSALYRMLGGVLGLAIYLLFHPGRRQILGTLRGPGLKLSIAGSFVGSYLAMMLWLGGMKYTKASVAAALNQTTNVFLFILAAWLLKESITRQRVAGIILGVGGAVLVTFG